MEQREEVSGNIFMRRWIGVAKGHTLSYHKHNFDHVTIAFVGSFRVRAVLPDGTLLDEAVVAPAHILIRGGVEHELTSLEDGSEWWCVYSHRGPNGEVMQEPCEQEAYQ